MADHPLAGAFRSLQEEGKSDIELAIMYKEEGNQWLKHGKQKDIDEAFNCYTEALIHIENAILDDAQIDKAPLLILKSQIYGNRAQASLQKRNYGKCIRDCDASLSLQGENVKSLYRRARALIEIRRVSSERSVLCDFTFNCTVYKFIGLVRRSSYCLHVYLCHRF
jgi:tetratricopeptide (TPR) repeat protein